MEIHSPHIATTPQCVAELDRLGDEIAELSAHVEAANLMSRLLPQYPRIRSRPSESGTTCRGSDSTRGQRAQAGWGSV